jgi:hypothetical protein
MEAKIEINEAKALQSNYYHITLRSSDGFYTWGIDNIVEELIIDRDKFDKIVHKNFGIIANNEVFFIKQINAIEFAIDLEPWLIMLTLKGA